MSRLSQLCEVASGEHLDPHLHLEVSDHGDEVRVARPLTDSIYCALDLSRPGLDRDERISDRAAGVIVGVDADRDVRECLANGANGCRHLAWQRAAIGIAEHYALGAGSGCGAESLDRIAGVFTPTIEEVFGVKKDPLALGDEIADRFRDHRQVFLRRDAHNLLNVEHRRLADERHDRRNRRGENIEPFVFLGAGVAAPRHSEGDDFSVA